MRKIKEILRLRAAGIGLRGIARSCNISHSTVSELLRRADHIGLSWPLPDGLDDATLEAQLYGKPAGSRVPSRPEPDWSEVDREMRRKGVTLRLLWSEYKKRHPDGYPYSQYCARYQAWKGKVDVVLRQHHRAGEKLFVDYSGQTMPVVDGATGEVWQAELFVAVLGASNYTYAEATRSQGLNDWIGSHVRAFAFFGGVPEIVVPDNLKSGVKHSHRYEPDLNPTYQELAAHYGIAVIPARVRKPRDKAKVEAGVGLAERWILAALRNRTFFSLAELNQAIAVELHKLNDAPFQKLDGSRRSQFETLDRPALQPLPPERYIFAQWKQATVNIDHHVEVVHQYYSVPYQLVREKVDVRLTETTVEVFHKGQRVAGHKRLYGRKGQFSTEETHQPASHRRHQEWTPSRLVRWAEQTGPATADLVQRILDSKPHPEQGYRSCLGLMRLGKSYEKERLEAAAQRALAGQAFSYKSVKSILERGLDQVPLEETPEMPPIAHANVRGGAYYTDQAKGAHSAC